MTAVVLSAPNRERSKSLNTKTLCRSTQASMAKAGRRPRQITTADGRPAMIQMRDNVLHSMRHAGARRVLRFQQGLEAGASLLGHDNSRCFLKLLHRTQKRLAPLHTPPLSSSVSQSGNSLQWAEDLGAGRVRSVCPQDSLVGSWVG